MLIIESTRSSKKTLDGVVVSYNGQTLRFNGKATIKLERSFKSAGDDAEEANLFDCQNEYIENTFTKEQKIALFNCYQRGYDVVENGKFSDYQSEISKLVPIINDIFEIINPDKFFYFIQVSRHLVVPKELSVAASKGDYPEETTLLEKDYIELAKMTFLVRTVYPVLFSLLARFEDLMGGGYNELVAGKLLKDSPHVKHTAGWNRLVQYVQFTFTKHGVPQQSVNVASMEHFMERVVYRTIFNRLCCAVIPETEEGKNIATAISAEVRQCEASTGVYKRKEASYDADDDKRSHYEKYQISETVNSAKEAAQAEWFSFGLYDEEDRPRFNNRFMHQCKALGIKQEQLVDQVFDNLPTIWDFELGQHIVKILQLTYMGKLSPNIYYACSYEQLMAAIAIAQVWLAERGYYYLPSVLGAVPTEDGVRTLADVMKLNTEDREALDAICDVQAKNNEGRSNNEAVLAAAEFLDNFGNGIWKTNLELGVLQEPEVYGRVKKGSLFPLEITKEIKEEFMRLIIESNT